MYRRSRVSLFMEQPNLNVCSSTVLTAHVLTRSLRHLTPIVVSSEPYVLLTPPYAHSCFVRRELCYHQHYPLNRFVPRTESGDARPCFHAAPIVRLYKAIKHVPKALNNYAPNLPNMSAIPPQNVPPNSPKPHKSISPKPPEMFTNGDVFSIFGLG